MSNKFVDEEMANRPTDPRYGNVIKEIAKDGVCPFCPESLQKYHKNPILIDKEFWLATDNMYPYKGAKHHVLLLHKQHIITPEEIVPEAWQELQLLVREINTLKKIPGGTMFMRFGDTRFTGSSVAHLHAHLVSSDPDRGGYEPLLTRIG